MILIEANNLSMRFNLAREKVDTLKEYIIKMARKQLFYDEFWALKNITFSVQKGEVFGVIGLNGAGKSTLLKIVAGVLKPSEGKIRINGRIAPLIELGAGFDMELSARENIYLYGAMLGHSKKFMEQSFDNIVEFSELIEFLDVPLKNFSSGMTARLGFSIATMVMPDILIVDEVLSVGDYQFQNKCEQKIKSMIDAGTTVLIVSHSIEQIQRLCDRVLWLEHGNVKLLGDTNEVALRYQ